MMAVLTTSELESPVILHNSSRAFSFALLRRKLCCFSSLSRPFFPTVKSYTKTLQSPAFREMELYASV